MGPPNLYLTEKVRVALGTPDLQGVSNPFLWLCWSSLLQFSPVEASVGPHRPLMAAASLTAEHRLWARWLQELQVAVSTARAQQSWLMGFTCSVACGIFPDQGLNLHPLQRQADSYPLYHQGSPASAVLSRCRSLAGAVPSISASGSALITAGDPESAPWRHAEHVAATSPMGATLSQCSGSAARPARPESGLYPPAPDPVSHPAGAPQIP